MRSRTRSRSLLTSTFLLPVGLAALAVAVVATAREVHRRRVVQREIRALEAEVARTERQRDRLSELLQRTGTPEFLEREARLRLGLQKPGETVLIVPEGSASAASSPDGEVPAEGPPSNLKKWWQHIFR